MEKFKVSVTGCGLGDFIYNDIDFSSPSFQKYLSLQAGDGGWAPGNLVFTQELETFAGKPFSDILDEIAGERSYNAFNIGGPALVCMINAAQLLFEAPVELSFYGARANDDKGKAIMGLLESFPINLDNYKVIVGETPYTDVLSDPLYQKGKGERTFVNNIACAGSYNSLDLDAEFWKSDLLVFGGTALVPQIHNDLTALLFKAKQNDCFTFVNTVYDFPNEKRNPNKPWPLGNTLESLPLIDLLVMDYEEALRISGKDNFKSIVSFFKLAGSNAFIITHGTNATYIYSSGKLFETIEAYIPVCDWISADFIKHPHLKGDTTGCGDNFAGAVIASVVRQKVENRSLLSLRDAAEFGTVSGALACYSVGGTYFEKYDGEKLEKVNEMLEMYLVK